MSELEKAAAQQYLAAAAKIPPEYRSAALEKANTYVSGLADMASILKAAAPGKEESKQ